MMVIMLNDGAGGLTGDHVDADDVGGKVDCGDDHVDGGGVAEHNVDNDTDHLSGHIGDDAVGDTMILIILVVIMLQMLTILEMIMVMIMSRMASMIMLMTLAMVMLVMMLAMAGLMAVLMMMLIALAMTMLVWRC